MKHRDKYKRVFVCSFWLENITNKTYVEKSHMPNMAWDIVTQYVINGRDMIIEIQLKTASEIA